MASVRVLKLCAALSTALSTALFVGLVAPLTSACDDAEEAPRVMGREGLERWVLTLNGDVPTLDEYRKLVADDPQAVNAFTKKQRAALEETHKDLFTGVAALGGHVSAHWWMSNQLTIEIPAAAVATLRARKDVRSLEPDQMLAAQVAAPKQ